MARALTALMIGLLGAAATAPVAGCRDRNPPPPRVPVPTQHDREARLREREEMRPLPEPSYEDPATRRPFEASSGGTSVRH